MAEEVPAGWPNGFGQFAAGAGMHLQRTPEQACVVVRLLRTTDPPRAHLWAMFLCEQKGGSAGGSPAKRLTSLVTDEQTRGGGRRARETLGQSGDDQTEGCLRQPGETLDQLANANKRNTTANTRSKWIPAFAGMTRGGVCVTVEPSTSVLLTRDEGRPGRGSAKKEGPVVPRDNPRGSRRVASRDRAGDRVFRGRRGGRRWRGLAGPARRRVATT